MRLPCLDAKIAQADAVVVGLCAGAFDEAGTQTILSVPSILEILSNMSDLLDDIKRLKEAFSMKLTGKLKQIGTPAM